MDILFHDLDAVAVIQKGYGYFLLLAERQMLSHPKILFLPNVAVDFGVVLLRMVVLGRGKETARVVFIFDLPVALGVHNMMKGLDDELYFEEGELLVQGSKNILDLIFLRHSFGVFNFLGTIIVDFLKNVFLVGLDDIFDSVEIDPKQTHSTSFPLAPEQLNNTIFEHFLTLHPVRHR